MDTSEVAEELTSWAVRTLEALPVLVDGGRLPKVAVGQWLGGETHADLLHVLGLLDDLGVDQLGGQPVLPLMVAALDGIEPHSTHTFFSYRVAESLARYGTAADNVLLAALSEGVRTRVIEAMAFDDTWVERLDAGELSANYAAVLCRWALAADRLGLAVDDSLISGLIDRTKTLLARNPTGAMDDSPDGEGGRFDIYMLDVCLFSEPFADRLGEAWRRSFAMALRVALPTASRSGAVIPWGRSSGALSNAVALEASALALRRAPLTERDRWAAMVHLGAVRLRRWFSAGTFVAYRGRSPYGYRGPHLQQQMALDVLGKALTAARTLRAIDEPARVPDDDPLRAGDSWIEFGTRSGVWSYRSDRLAFCLPVTGNSWSDYLPAPRAPGVFETPVDSPIPTWLPTAWSKGIPYVPARRPVALAHECGSLHLRYDRFVPLARQAEPDEHGLPIALDAHYAVEARTVRVRWQLSFEAAPEALSLSIPETASSPLRIEIERCSTPFQATTSSTAGMAPWRSFWSELSSVHEFVVEPAGELLLQWSVRPKLRVATDQLTHPYHRSLSGALQDDVAFRTLTSAILADASSTTAMLESTDVFVMHWPEGSLLGGRASEARRFVDLLAEHDVALVWIQHNLLPHDRWRETAAIYRIIAAHADAVIHHSESGRTRSIERHPFRSRALHRVIPHGHWGDLVGPLTADDRQRAADALGLPRCDIRIGVFGAPRVDKRVDAFVDAFDRADRHDLQLVIVSSGPSTTAAHGSRAIVGAQQLIDRQEYDRWLSACDVLAFPFRTEPASLTTGVVADAVGAGIGALVSDWPFLSEYLGDAAIQMGDTPDSWSRSLRTLSVAQVDRAKRAARDLQPRYSWSTLAREHLDIYEDALRKPV